MTTISTPKTLSDLRYQDNVVHVGANEIVDVKANRWFHELFDNSDYVHLNLLFREEGQQVWQAYQDAGSVDYLYLIK